MAKVSPRIFIQVVKGFAILMELDSYPQNLFEFDRHDAWFLLSVGIKVCEYKADTQFRQITDIISQSVGGGRSEINCIALKTF
jgi:hypothetical protein